jgi:hypothetical protein
MTKKDLDVGLGHRYFDIINNEQNVSNSTLTTGIVLLQAQQDQKKLKQQPAYECHQKHVQS